MSLLSGTDEGGVLYRHADSEYLGLNKTGSYIVSVLEQPQTMDAIAAAIETRFKVDGERALADTKAFLDSMLKAGVVAQCE